MTAEGVIRFRADHSATDIETGDLARFNGWRMLFTRLGLIGQQPHRYDGLGFGNMSFRKGNGFVITASQTGGEARLDASHLSEVSDWDIDGNSVISRGRLMPSSETMTHAAIYAASARTQAVVHVHAPLLWLQRDTLGLRSTRAGIEYGSVAMAKALQALAEDVRATPLVAMAGHTDGIVAWGASLDSACQILISQLVDGLSAEGYGSPMEK